MECHWSSCVCKDRWVVWRVSAHWPEVLLLFLSWESGKKNEAVWSSCCKKHHVSLKPAATFDLKIDRERKMETRVMVADRWITSSPASLCPFICYFLQMTLSLCCVSWWGCLFGHFPASSGVSCQPVRSTSVNLWHLLGKPSDTQVFLFQCVNHHIICIHADSWNSCRLLSELKFRQTSQRSLLCNQWWNSNLKTLTALKCNILFRALPERDLFWYFKTRRFSSGWVVSVQKAACLIPSLSMCSGVKL